MAQQVNPYIAGMPLRGEQGFFGRQTSLSWVANELRNPGTNALVLFGQRRIGKTTLLLQLQRTLPAEAFLPVYFDLQDQATRNLGDVLADLADTITGRLGFDAGDALKFDNRGQVFQRAFLPRMFERAGDGRRLILLFDEFDVMDQVAEADLPPEAAARSLLPFLRKLMNEEPRLGFVFVAGRRPQDLSLDFSATFKASLSHELWVLDEESARTLILQAEENGTLHYTPAAIERILALASRHPYLTQLLCQRIWERAYNGKPEGIPQIDAPEVDAAIPVALETGSQALEWLWDGLAPAERIFAALADIAEEGQPISEDQVVQTLSAYAARLRTREVELAPRDLVQRRVIEQDGERAYRFAVEIFRLWVQKNRPLQTVKDELDRVDKTADHVFRAGEAFFHDRKWEEAVGYFERTLKENPLHFRAHLLMGESLLYLARTQEAVAALQKAYQLDRDEARLPLARAWMEHAQFLVKSGEDDAVLGACEEALAISPHERAARELKSAIWNRRGDAALGREELTVALAAYQQAENAGKVAAVAERREENEDLKRRFADGLGALQQGDWGRAVTAFEWIVHRRPAYAREGQKAIHLLARAVDTGENPPHWLLVWLRRPQVLRAIIVSLALLFQVSCGLGGIVVYPGFLGLGPLAGLARNTPTPTSTFTPTFTNTPTPTPTFTLTLTPSMTPTQTPTPTDTSTNTLTPTNTPLPLPTLTPTNTPLPTLVIERVGSLNIPMKLIPAGAFEMGSDNGNLDELPVHVVFLDDFYLDQFEVTNELYVACVDAGDCAERNTFELRDPDLAQHPVTGVNWTDAQNFCAWRGAELPTEARWEKAARGGLVGMDYPWGNESPSCTAGAINGAQFGSCSGKTLTVGSFTANGYGLFDMAGNVWEWVADWYDGGYYGVSLENNPTGPETGGIKILRGGSWESTDYFIRSAFRSTSVPTYTFGEFFGFRCARSP